MKIKFFPNSVFVEWEATDKKIYEDTAFFYALKKQLNKDKAGQQWIKKNGVSGLNSIPYALRTKQKGETEMWICDESYAVRFTHKFYRDHGWVSLSLLRPEKENL